MEWFKGMREGLREKRISLKSPSDLPPREQEHITVFKSQIRQLIHKLGEGADDAQTARLADGFAEGLERTTERFLKGKSRAGRANLIKPKALDEEELSAILREYQGAIALILQFTRGLTTNTFKQASTLAPFWEAKELEELLTDEKIMAALKEAGAEMTEGEVKEVFTKAVRLRFAVSNISDPLGAVKRVGRHVKETLTDEKIMAALKEAGAEMAEGEVREVFTRGVRLHFAVHNISDPLEAVKRVGRHVKETLTDEKIMAALKEAGAEMTEGEVKEVFTKAVRLHFAVHNISDPLEAVKRVGRHVKETLTDEKIMAALKEAGVTMTPEEVREVFTKAVRLRFAVNNISDPLEAVGRVGLHLKETLTDEKIVEVLKKAGVTMTLEEVKEVFTKGVRLRFAVGNISDPLEAVGRVGLHLKETLTDEKIMAALKEAGAEMAEGEVREVFTRGVRLHFAVNNISDPLEACVEYAKGNIPYAGRYYGKNGKVAA